MRSMVEGARSDDVLSTESASFMAEAPSTALRAVPLPHFVGDYVLDLAKY